MFEKGTLGYASDSFFCFKKRYVILFKESFRKNPFEINVTFIGSIVTFKQSYV